MATETFNEIASKIANSEGKKVQTSMGNVREILSIISDLIYEDANVSTILYENGLRRSKEGLKGKSEE